MQFERHNGRVAQQGANIWTLRPEPVAIRKLTAGLGLVQLNTPDVVFSHASDEVRKCNQRCAVWRKIGQRVQHSGGEENEGCDSPNRIQRCRSLLFVFLDHLVLRESFAGRLYGPDAEGVIQINASRRRDTALQAPARASIRLLAERDRSDTAADRKRDRTSANAAPADRTETYKSGTLRRPRCATIVPSQRQG